MAIKHYLGVARAPFLALPVTLVAAGGAAAFYEQDFVWMHTLLALLGLVLLHMAVNIFNEWSDMRSGIDLATRRTPFSGGSGTLPAGGMSLRAALIFGVVCAAIGLGIGIWFLTKLGWVLLPVMIAGAFCVVGYTDFLARIGLGELAAGFGLGCLPVVGTGLVQSGNINHTVVAASLPAFFMTFNLLLLNELPDEQADRAGGRRNLVLLLGRKGAARVYAAAGIATPVAIVATIVAGWLPVVTLAAALPSLLLLKPFAWAFGDTGREVPIPALGANVIWNLATNTLLAVTLIVARFIA
jgi:1,4-dihydroxy-2-naphthoate octaprenyltransferase